MPGLARTLFVSSRTLFASSRTLFVSSRTLFVSSRTLFASSRTFFASSRTLFASSRTLFASSRTLSTKLEKTLQTYIGEGMCAPGVGQILGQRLDKKKFEGCGHDKANVGL